MRIYLVLGCLLLAACGTTTAPGGQRYYSAGATTITSLSPEKLTLQVSVPFDDIWTEEYWEDPDRYSGKGTRRAQSLLRFTNREGLEDADYVEFGYWDHEINPQSFPPNPNAGYLEREDLTNYVVHPFFYGSAPYTGAVAGTAVYEGVSTGYFKNTVGPDPYGQYYADIALTVDFNDLTIKGHVDNFVEWSTRNPVGDQWAVTLQPTAIAADTLAFSGLADASERTTPQTGEYTGRFFGLDGPNTVAGTYAADFPTGFVAGGFGAVNSK